MQTLSSGLTAALIDIDARVDPRVPVDLYELYDNDAVPGVAGFDPVDAVETFAAQEITWNGIAYLREVKNRSEISRSMGEKTNSVTVNFSNVSRHMATLAQTATLEGMIMVIRTIVPAITDDSPVLFVGRCDKPGDITKGDFSMSARQDFGNINVSVPTSQYVAEDPNGYQPGNPLYEGIRFVAQSGYGPAGTTTVPSTSFFGRLLGRTKRVPVSQPYSSLDFTPYGEVIREIFGTVQVQAVPIMFEDIGYWLEGLWAWCKGPIKSVTNIVMRNFAAYGLYSVQTHTGEIGGTGDPLPGLGPPEGLTPQTGGNITEDARFPGSGLFSRLAFSGLSILQSGINDEPVAVDEPPIIVGLVQGRRIDLPDGSGVFSREDWSDNPVHISRFILTNDRFANIDPAFMDDAVNYRTGLHCDEPLLDITNTQTILIPNIETAQAGNSFKRFQSSAIITPDNVKYISGDLLLPAAPDEPPDGPYTPLPAPPTPIPDVFTPVPVLLKRYTANFSISEEVKAVDLVYKNVFPTAKLFMKVGKNAKVGIYSEKAADSTKVRTATVVGATSINVLDVTPWKTGPDLLTGRLLAGWSLETSEVRDLTSAVFSTSGNSIPLVAGDTGTTTLTASGATLSGGSTSVQASGTLTVGGTPAAGDTITGTIDGVAVVYTLTSADTTETAAAMLAAYINATADLKPYIKAFWSSASPTVVTVKCLHGALTLSSTTGFPTFLKAHDVGEEILRIAMSFATNSQDVYSAWPASTLVLLNDIYLPTVLNGHKYQVTTGGTTGSAEPTWPTTAGGTVASGTAVFTEIGSTVLAQAGLKRANIVKDSFKWPLGSTQSSVNQIKGKFRDKVNDFAETPFKVNDPVHQAQVKKIYPKDIDLTAVDNFHQVFRLASAELAKNREGDWFISLETGPQGLPLEEGDLIACSDDSGGLVNVVTRIEDLSIKPNHHVAIQKSRLYSTNMFSDDVTATPIPIPSTLRHTQTVDSIAVFIDNFALRDADALIPGFYIAVSRDLAIQGDWRGWKLYADYGDGYVKIADGDVAATMGTADTILGSADPTVFDTWQTMTANSGTEVITAVGHHFANGNSVQVMNSGGALPGGLAASTTYFVRDVSGDTFKLAATSGGSAINLTTNGTGTNSIKNVLELTLKYGTPSPAPEPFATVTEADLIANPYKNLFQYGSEYLQAATVVSNGDQSYTLSDFYRGRFGTTSTQLTHSADEDIVFLNGAEKFVEIDPARAGIAYNYKVVTINQNVADADAVSFTWNGGTIRPLPPTSLSAVRDGSLDWFIEADGHPRAHESPATYALRLTRASDAEFLRDIPISTGGVMAMSFPDIDTFTGTIIIDKNNLSTSGVVRSAQRIEGPGQFIEFTLPPIDTDLGGEVNVSTIEDPTADWEFFPEASHIITCNRTLAELGWFCRILEAYEGFSGPTTDFVLGQKQTITNATNASPILVTSEKHGLVTGQDIKISGVVGNTAANDFWTVTEIDDDTFSLDGSTGSGAYVSGGIIEALSYPVGDGPVAIRAMFLGTEVRFYKNWTLGRKAFAISHRDPTEHFPMKVRVELGAHTSGPSVGFIDARNFVLGTSEDPQTIYSISQQEADLLRIGESAGTAAAGIGVADLGVELWQSSRYPNTRGGSVSGVF